MNRTIAFLVLVIAGVLALLSGCDGCVPPKEYVGPVPLCEPQVEECQVDSNCGANAKCIDTKCIAQIDPALYQFSNTISYISSIQVPAEFGEDCCFDLNGDGQNNDMLGYILTTLVPSYGENWVATETVNGLIDKGDLLYLLEYRLPEDGCGPSTIWIYNGKGDLDHDGIVDQPTDDRASGNGVFQIDPLDFAGGFGPGAQFNNAYLEGDTLYAEGGKIPITVQIPNGPVLSIMAEGVVVESKISIEEDAVVTVDRGRTMRRMSISSVNTLDENGEVECGAKAGGYVPLETIADQIDEMAKDCPCAGIDPDQPLIVQEIRDGEFQASCVQTLPDTMETCSIPIDNNVCYSLTTLCALIETGVVNQTCDVSSGRVGDDGTTAYDSISFALRFCIDGAILASEPLAPDFIAVDDYIEIPVFRYTERLNVLFNDTDMANDRPTIIDIFQDDADGQDGRPDNGGTVEIDSSGSALVYYPASPNLTGTEHFTYTIGDDTKSMTARVTVKQIPVCNDWDGDGYGAYCDLGEDCDVVLPYVWTTAGCASCGDNDGDGYYAGCDAYGSLENPEDNFTIPGPDCDDDAITGTTCNSGCNTYYPDTDDDGHGVPGNSITACVQPAGYAATDDDCDPTSGAHWSDCSLCQDNDGDGYGDYCDLGTDCDDDAITGASCHNTCGTYYDDTDGDGYGDITSSLEACSQPTGYQADNSDCDTTSAAHWNDCSTCVDNDGDDYGADCDLGDDCDDDPITGDTCNDSCTTYYDDTDDDGYGDLTSSIAACVLPAGYQIDNSDCDTTSAAHWADCGACADNDGDDYGVACDLGTDCDDDPVTGDSCHDSCTTFYDDTDNDGYGDSSITVDACALPTGYQANSSDCDISSAAHWSDCGVCTDTDGDDYGDGCDLGADCDDTLATGESCHDNCTVFYDDTDGDEYGDHSLSLDACTTPVGYVADDTDCDPSDELLWHACGTCVDVDGDGYGAGCDPGTDCDDTPATGTTCTSGCVTYYLDADGDDYGVSTTSAVACSAPDGYVDSDSDFCDDDPYSWTELGCTSCIDDDADHFGANCDYGVDCDDADPFNWTTYGCTNCYDDSDDDGYFAGCDTYTAPTTDPLARDYCGDDSNNWTELGCSHCLDWDGDGRGTNCDVGADCTDFDNSLYNCSTTLVTLFEGSGDWPPGTTAVALFAAEINGSAGIDIAFANSGSDDFSLLLNNGSGFFEHGNQYTVGTGAEPFDLVAADFDGDGWNDIATANRGTNNIAVIKSRIVNGMMFSGFYSPSFYASGAQPVAIFADDFDGDGSKDLAALNSGDENVTIFINDSNGVFTVDSSDYAVGAEPSSLVAGDFNLDGYSDLAIANKAGNSISVILNTGMGTFGAQTVYTTDSGPVSLFAADFNDDGFLDITTANNTGGSVGIMFNDGDGGFSAQTTMTVDQPPRSIWCGDLDGDGYQDITVVKDNAESADTFINNGDGTFTAGGGCASSWGPMNYNDTMLADINGDSELDLLYVVPSGAGYFFFVCE